MKILYLIGNGLDVKYGLKTRYSEFYKSAYTPTDNDSNGVKALKENIKDNINDWSDLEARLGDYSADVQDESEYLEVFKDIRAKLVEYIKIQDSAFLIETSDKQKTDFTKLVRHPQNFLEEGERNNVNQFVNSIGSTTYTELDFITFNYTQTLEKILGFSNSPIIIKHTNFKDLRIRSIEHIHGLHDYRFILGVDDKDQIKNKSFRSDRLLRTIVKPTQNSRSQLMRDNRSIELIRQADMICIYGMSIGKTDKMWWQHIVNVINDKNKRLIVFWYDENEASSLFCDSKFDIEDEVFARIFSNTNLTESQKQTVRQKTYVVYKNDQVFSIPK